MLLYSPTITPRLQYILQFLGDLWLGRTIPSTTDPDKARNFDGLLINYSAEKISGREYHIIPAGLLQEQGIKFQDIVVENKDVLPWFFTTPGHHPFDIFSAIFYLLSRYEEYLPHKKDSYGRYAHTNSLAFREGFLHRPLVNEWINDIRKRMEADDRWRMADDSDESSHALRLTPHEFRPIPYIFLPTYDIDIAWSIRHKGFGRLLTGGLRELLTGKWGSLKNRLAVLRGKGFDPFDVYGWLNQLHEQHQLRPYYFFLFAPERGRYDKNIDPRHPAMQALAYDHAIRYPVGIHPSWKSGDKPELIKKESALLSKATGVAVTASRQHYIRMNLPGTYRQLLDAGIRFDFSMGYGSINGFRASAALPFYWYDLENEQSTHLQLFPFCYMEANSYFEQGHDAAAGITELRRLHSSVKANGGLFIMIWHNSFLTDQAPWAEWRAGYEEFLKQREA